MKCPICKNNCEGIKHNKYFPFCSGKCKEVDLYKWLNGEYTYLDFEEEKLPITFVDSESKEIN